MAADKSDEPGVLGNLPRSRPGHRSDKRGGAGASGADEPAQPKTFSTPTAAAPKKAAARAKPKPKRATAARPKPTRAAAKPKPAAAKPKRAPATAAQPKPAPRIERQPQPSQKSDPLTDAVRIAGKVAEAGIKLLRRLPGR